ncbi:glycosyltransferase [Aquimarina sp. ERC-38]|uniref:glycosyltransferase n=1 Tax=Aquimarina sp. ERC-38 TaxID=2949996 RepID=UPI0022464F52|nr:glycosyltransferase [Aquimarina sp. ERC-38]UZO82405.1 glycosyltransferase [Aquimarina sp. ERC-38]
MKIAVIAHAHYPIREPYPGGLEMLTHILCNQLVLRGHDVDLYAHKDSETLAHVIPLCDQGMQLETVDQYLAELDGIDEAFVLKNLAYSKAINRIANADYDVVHNHSLHYAPIIIGNNINKPMITTLHTPPFPLLQLGTVAVKDHNNQVFTAVSNRLGQIWQPYIDHYEVVYNGIDLNQWQFSPNKKSEHLLFTGRICKEKGVKDAISFALKAKLPLKIVGPKCVPEYFEKEVAPHLSNPLISYEGHLKQSEINMLYENALATLFFSTWEEPYGLVIAESLATGTPVIAYNKGAAPEILTDSCGILLEEGSTFDNAGEVLTRLLTIVPKDCRQRAEDFCNIQYMIDSYEDLYYRLTYKSQPKTMVV